MKSHAFVALFPVPGAVVFLEASESFVPDRRVEATGIYTGRAVGERKDAFLPVLHVSDLTREPDLISAMKRLVLAVDRPFGKTGRADRITLAVDVSHATFGPIASRRVWEVSRLLKRTQLALVDSSVFDLPVPERSGWRVKVGRRAIVGALFEAVEEGRLKLEIPATIRKEAAGQISALTARPDRETNLEAETLARTIGLAAWIQSVVPRA